MYFNYFVEFRLSFAKPMTIWWKIFILSNFINMLHKKTVHVLSWEFYGIWKHREMDQKLLLEPVDQQHPVPRKMAGLSIEREAWGFHWRNIDQSWRRVRWAWSKCSQDHGAAHQWELLRWLHIAWIVSCSCEMKLRTEERSIAIRKRPLWMGIVK